MMVLQPFPLKSFRTSAPVLAALLVIASAWLPDIDELGAEDCSPPLKPELVAAVEKVDLAWRCRLSAIMRHSVTGGVVTGPVRTPLPASLYIYFLDHPAVTASLCKRWRLAPTRRGCTARRNLG